MPPIGAGTVGPYTVEVLGESIQVDSPLKGAHQHRNLALAIAAAAELAGMPGFPVSPATIAEGIRQTRWPGRLERIHKDGVEWILDVAHNPAGAWALRVWAEQAYCVKSSPRCLIFACLRDKPIAEMAQILFPLFDQVVLAPIHSARAAALGDLMAAAQATGTPAVAAESVGQAIELALQQVKQRDGEGVIVISGSVFLVGEARPLLLARRGDSQ